MITRPAFSPVWHVESFPDEHAVLLVAETDRVVLNGQLPCAVACLIDGRRTADEIVDLLSEDEDPAAVYYTLAQLEQQGYVVEADDGVPAGRAALWASLRLNASDAERRCASTLVAVQTVGEPPVDAAAVLADAGLRLGEPAAFQIVVTDDYLRPAIAEINAQALAAATPWMLVKPAGQVPWIGPIFRPGTTACWECLAHRLHLNHRVETFLQRRHRTTEPVPVFRAAVPPTLNVALAIGAFEAMRWIGAGGGTPLEGTVRTLDVAAMEFQSHTLIRRPHCPRCGAPDSRAVNGWAPPVLVKRPKAFTTDGGHRTIAPDETVRALTRLVSPITGVVSALVRISGEHDPDLHLYGVGHNFGTAGDTLSLLKRTLRSSSGGKGVSDAQARASALSEAVERVSGVYQGDEPRRRGTYRRLGDAAIHPNACALYSDAQLQGRDEWNARGEMYQWVPRPFDEEAERDWTPIWSLTHRDWKYIPTAYCYYSYPERPDRAECRADSNGNASGNTVEEAIVQGFMELVERDSVALWWYNRLRPPAVDLDSFDDPFVERMRARLAAHGRDFWALDLTSDLGIPTFAAVSRRPSPPERVLLGFGAHFDPRIGLLRALTEHNQTMMHVDPPHRTAPAPADPDLRRWMETATTEEHAYLRPADGARPATLDGYGYEPRGDLLDDVAAAQAMVESFGMEMLVLEQTRLDIGFPVVKVVVPGLRHFWARFAPGRLYDVPVKMRWVPAALREADLNPVPFFF
ncbi:MAG TPA: TOMM precursor leader peptide-binding protein [bacterium]|nr:TOMM precursor leader peptide-binding protein [bacterium]